MSLCFCVRRMFDKKARNPSASHICKYRCRACYIWMSVLFRIRFASVDSSLAWFDPLLSSPVPNSRRGVTALSPWQSLLSTELGNNGNTMGRWDLGVLCFLTRQGLGRAHGWGSCFEQGRTQIRNRNKKCLSPSLQRHQVWLLQHAEAGQTITFLV